MLNAKYAAIFVGLIIIWICDATIYSTKGIPVEQFKINNFTEELWHPTFSKAMIDKNNFVIIDNYKEHKRKPKVLSFLQMDSNEEKTSEVFKKNFYDSEMTPDTELPGQNATNKGPYNCAWKFTLADTPKTDSENYSTLINQDGEIDKGMLGEFVNLYDTNKDLKDPHSVTKSATNEDTSKKKKEEKEKQSLNDTPKKNIEEKPKAIETDTTNQMNMGIPNPGMVNNSPSNIQTGLPQNTYPQQMGVPQIMYVPVYTYLGQPQGTPVVNQLMANPSNLQMNMQQMQGGQYQMAPNPSMPQPQFGPQVQYTQLPMQMGQTPMFPQQVYNGQAMYMQQPGMMSQAVGMGMNQVPTLVYRT